MFRDLGRAFESLGDRRVRGYVWLGIGLSAVALIGLTVAVSTTLAALSLVDIGWLDSVIDWLGALATAIVAVLLFPATVGLVSGLFLDRVAALVEARDYPEAARAAKDVPIATAAVAGVRLFLIAAAVNLLLLPVYLLLPGINLLLYLLVNGYLLGREFVELVALRHLSRTDADRLRRERRFAVWSAGAAIAALMVVPILNLAAPILSAIFMTHRFHALRAEGKTRY